MVFENKHVIRTETMKARILGHSDIMTDDTNTHYLAEIGVQQVIDTDDLDVLSEILDSGTENHTADAAKSVDTNFNHIDLSL